METATAGEGDKESIASVNFLFKKTIEFVLKLAITTASFKTFYKKKVFQILFSEVNSRV
jgi:hypothetical protein